MFVNVASDLTAVNCQVVDTKAVRFGEHKSQRLLAHAAALAQRDTEAACFFAQTADARGTPLSTEWLDAAALDKARQHKHITPSTETCLAHVPIRQCRCLFNEEFCASHSALWQRCSL